MCRTLLTVIHHACQPNHLTRQTRTEQCYAAHLFGARACAPGPPRHCFYEQHLPGAACQSCVYPHRAYNTDTEEEVNDDYDMDPAAIHNQRLLFRQNAFYHPAAYLPRPLAFLPAPVNPPYLGTGQHTHEQVPYVGPFAPMGVHSPHVNPPPVDPFAQPHDLSQSDGYSSGGSPSGGYPNAYTSGDTYEEAANGPREPVQSQAQQQRQRTPPARGPLVPIMEDEQEDHSDNTHGARSEDFVHIERPPQFERNPSPPRSPPPVPYRRRPHLSDRPMPGRLPSASPVSSAYSPMMGNLRGGGGGGDSDSGSDYPRPRPHVNSDSSSHYSRAFAPNSEVEDEEERELREALERSAREFVEREDDEQRRVTERSLREHGYREEGDLRRVAAESLRDYADAEHAALVQAMHDSAAEAEEQRKRVEKEEEREVLRRSVRTWREEVTTRMGQWEQGSNERGSGRGSEDGVEMFGDFTDLDELWTKRAGIDRSTEKGESSTAQTGCITSEASCEQVQRFQGREDQDPNPPTSSSSPKPAQRVCTPPSTVEDEPEHPTWSFEGVAPQPQVQDDASTIKDPAAEVTRAMEEVGLSTDAAEYIRTKRIARFTGNNDE